MIKKLIHQEQTAKCSVTVGIMILIVLVMFASCSSTSIDTYNQSLGSCKKSQEVTNLFRSSQFHPDYKYYYADFMNNADAVVGIDSNYLLEKASGRGREAVRWIELETTPSNMEKLVQGIGKKGKPYGADIFDHAGNQLGIIYTFEEHEYQVRVRMLEDNLIRVVPRDYKGSDWRFTS